MLQRSEKPKSGSSRPIFSRFLRYGDKELVMDLIGAKTSEGHGLPQTRFQDFFICLSTFTSNLVLGLT